MAKRVFRTKKKLSGGGQKIFRPWGEYEVGDILIGKYVDTHTDQYNKECWVIEVEDAQLQDKKFAKSIIGKRLVLNAAGMLDKAMREVDTDELVQIEYQGQSTIEKGKHKGKDSHVFEVQTLIDDEDGDEDEDEDQDEDEDDEDMDL